MAYAYALALSQAGHEVEVFTPQNDSVDLEKVKQIFKINWLKPAIKYGNAAFLPQLYQRLQNFDVVNLHYPFFGGAEVVHLLKKIKKAKIKLVITYHMDNFGRGVFGTIFKLNERYLMPRILKAADKIICTSIDYIENSAAKSVYQSNQQKFVAVPPGVDTTEFQPRLKNQDLLKKYFILPDEKVVLFVGGLDAAHYFKGLDLLIDAFAETDLNQVKLLIVGEGNLKENYIHKVKELNLGDKIIFAESVDDEELPLYYNLADLFVLPSIDSSEAFGIVLLEAMASGVPILASNLPGVRSVVQKGISGELFAVKNGTDLAEKIKIISNDDNLRKIMALKARAMAEQYSQEKINQNLVRLFSDLK